MSRVMTVGTGATVGQICTGVRTHSVPTVAISLVPACPLIHSPFVDIFNAGPFQLHIEIAVSDDFSPSPRLLLHFV